jgi:ferric-dicitrate binding protein FerR (iron transport regulator)
MNRHNGLEKTELKSREFFSNGSFDWKKSEDEVWAELEAKMGKSTVVRRFGGLFGKLAVAASVFLIAGIFSFLKFYHITYNTSSGVHQSIILPDGSKAELNAGSKLKIYPYWWKISRTVALSGEAFFEVEKGNTFKVLSKIGITEVMGTSFNVFARESTYKVTCLAGRVKVISKSNESVVLYPNQKATIVNNGKINFEQNVEIYPEISWKENVFLFTATPIELVLKEIERQYGVTVKSVFKGSAFYSGNFSKHKSVEEVLGYICPAMSLKYRKLSENHYEVSTVN